MDEYFGTLVEFDAITIIRNHGCTKGRPRCDDVEAMARQPEGYLWVPGDPTGFHRPCCAGEPQPFHRDLDIPGSITINIALQDQRLGFGPLRFCYANATAEGTQVSPNQRMKAMRRFDPSLDLLVDPLGFVQQEVEGQYDEQYYDILEPFCNNADRGEPETLGGRVEVFPMLKVGDISVYEATTMHSGTSNVEAEDRDIIALTFSWRKCPAAEMGSGFDCAECTHCEGKTGWSTSPHGIDGPDGQRLKMETNHKAQLTQMQDIVAKARVSPQYADAVAKFRRGGHEPLDL